MKDKAYYENFDKRMNYLHESIDYHIRQACRYKELYYMTKGKRGYGWLNKFAAYMNKKHAEKGINIGLKGLDECFDEMTYLSNYFNKKQ